MVWAKPYLGDKYLVQFEAQLTEAGWAGWALNGPGYGNSLNAGYGCFLEKSKFSLRRNGHEVQAVDLPSAIAPGEWSRVQAEVSAGKIAVTMNEIPVALFDDPQPLAGALHGWFGLSADHGSAFRNLSIWSPSTETNKERQLTPPVTEKPLANGKLLYNAKLVFPPGSKTRDLGPEWWKSQPEFVAIDKGTVILSGPNGTPAVVLDKPLPADVACEVEFEYPGDEAVNFSIMLWHAEKAPHSAKEAAAGWTVALPMGRGNSIARWQNSPEEAGDGFGNRSPNLASTDYYAPIARRKYLARIETRGDELRLFQNGGLVFTAKRPDGAAAPAMPVFLAMHQFYGGSKVHAVRVYEIANEAGASAKPDAGNIQQTLPNLNR